MAEDSSRVGGGAYAIATLPTRVCVVRPRALSAGELAAALRRNDPPIFTRVRDDAVHLDLRTVLPEQDLVVRAALVEALTAASE